MKLNTILFFLFFAIVIEKPLFSQSKKKDTLQLLNGQIIVGTIRDLTIGKVKFDANDIGTVNIKKTKIHSMISTGRIYRIEMADKRVFFSNLNRGKKAGTILVKNDSVNINIAIVKITSVDFISDSINKGALQGNISMGYSYTKSSKFGRFNIDGTVEYLLKRSDFFLNINFIHTHNQKIWSRDKENISLAYIYHFVKPFEFSGILNYQRNLELRIMNRYQEGALAGYKAINKSSMDLTIFSGLVVNQENYSDSLFTNQIEIPLMFNYQLYKFSKPEINITTSLKMYGSLTELGRFREDFDFKINWVVFSDFIFKVQFYNSYDNKSYSIKESNVDFGVVLGVGYTF